MSEPVKHHEDKMLASLIAAEEARLAAAPQKTGLSAGAIAAVTQRLLSEKKAILADFDKTPALAVRKKTSVFRIVLPAAAAAALLLGVGLPLWLRQAPGVDARLQTTRGSVTLNGVAAQPGTALKNENVIATGAKALVVVAWGEPAGTLIGQNTRVIVRKMEKADRPRIEIENTAGLTFTRIEKGQAEFMVYTPTAVLAVRGTGFSVQVTPDGTTLSVIDGTVETTLDKKFVDTLPAEQRAKAAAPVSVQPKQKIVISTSQRSALVSHMTGAELAYLGKLEKMLSLSREKAAGADAARAAAIDKESDALQADIFAAGVNPPANGAPALTLADIRKKYGKISRVNLKTGASYTGFFTLKGAQMEIITPRGVVRVPTAQLKDVQDLN